MAVMDENTIVEKILILTKTTNTFISSLRDIDLKLPAMYDDIHFPEKYHNKYISNNIGDTLTFIDDIYTIMTKISSLLCHIELPNFTQDVYMKISRTIGDEILSSVKIIRNQINKLETIIYDFILNSSKTITNPKDFIIEFSKKSHGQYCFILLGRILENCDYNCMSSIYMLINDLKKSSLGAIETNLQDDFEKYKKYNSIQRMGITFNLYATHYEPFKMLMGMINKTLGNTALVYQPLKLTERANKDIPRVSGLSEYIVKQLDTMYYIPVKQNCKENCECDDRTITSITIDNGASVGKLNAQHEPESILSGPGVILKTYNRLVNRLLTITDDMNIPESIVDRLIEKRTNLDIKMDTDLIRSRMVELYKKINGSILDFFRTPEIKSMIATIVYNNAIRVIEMRNNLLYSKPEKIKMVMKEVKISFLLQINRITNRILSKLYNGYFEFNRTPENNIGYLSELIKYVFRERENVREKNVYNVFNMTQKLKYLTER